MLSYLNWFTDCVWFFKICWMRYYSIDSLTMTQTSISLPFSIFLFLRTGSGLIYKSVGDDWAMVNKSSGAVCVGVVLYKVGISLQSGWDDSFWMDFFVDNGIPIFCNSHSQLSTTSTTTVVWAPTNQPKKKEKGYAYNFYISINKSLQR